jgi:hypothetical protein
MDLFKNQSIAYKESFLEMNKHPEELDFYGACVVD